MRQRRQTNVDMGDVMDKQEFKSKMSAFRKAVSAASWKSMADFNAAIDSDDVLASCLRPRNLPVISRSVMLHLYSSGGLDAVRHIDSVEIKYN